MLCPNNLQVGKIQDENFKVQQQLKSSWYFLCQDFQSDSRPIVETLWQEQLLFILLTTQ